MASVHNILNGAPGLVFEDDVACRQVNFANRVTGHHLRFGHLPARGGRSRGCGSEARLLAGHGFDDAERPCRLHHALQPEAAPPE